MRVLTSRDKTLVMPVTREKTSHRFVCCVVLMLLWYFKYCINGTYIANSFSRAQVLAKATNFAKSNLQGCRFYKAYLVRGPLWLFALVCSR